MSEELNEDLAHVKTVAKRFHNLGWGLEARLFDRIIARLEDAEGQLHSCPKCGATCKECDCAADRLERAERVVERVRAILRDEQNDEQSDLSYDHLSSQRYNALNRIRSAFAAYDTTRADTVRE